MKTCSKCKVTKPESAFGADKSRKDGLYPQCNECKSAYYKATYANVASKRLNSKYGITQEDYDRMLVEQGHSCKLCGAHQSTLRRRLAVDHCHSTGCVRGLLCDDCNIALGKMKDNIETLQNALDYLKEKR